MATEQASDAGSEDARARELAVETAYGYLGTHYAFAAGDLEGPTGGGFDRAGFLRRVIYAATDFDIGNTFVEQLRHCERRWDGERAQAGDIIYWKNSAGTISSMLPVRHAALYTGLMSVISTPPGGPDQSSTFEEHSIESDSLIAGRDSEIIVAVPPYPGSLRERAERAERSWRKYQREVATRTWTYAEILGVFANATVSCDDAAGRLAYVSAVLGVTEEALKPYIAEAQARRERLGPEPPSVRLARMRLR